MRRAASARCDIPSHRVYGVGLGGDNTGLMFDLYDAAEQCELDIEGIMGEFHPGQMELNLRYGPALDAADRAFICKEMTRELAARKGYWITYMGRPMAHLVGSGLHINMSLTPVHGGANAFDDPTAEHGLSALARQCLGGLIAHHEGMAAMSAPLVNSYKRLIPGIIAGYWANWGLDNRISTYRIPCERGAGDTDRESHAVRQRQSVPRRGGDAQCRAARRRRRPRLRRAADRRRRHRRPTPTGTPRTISAQPSPRSRPTRCCARRWVPTWSRRS